MLTFKNEKSLLYQVFMPIIWIVVAITLMLSNFLDDTNYEIINRGLWISSALLWIILLGTKEVVAKKNKIGYMFYILAIVFIIFIISIYN